MSDIYKKVHEIIEKYEAENDKMPSIREIRAIAGAGSFSTISKAVNEYKKTIVDEKISDLNEAPATVKDAFLSFWSAAEREAKLELAAEREAYKTENEKIKSELEEAYKYIDELEQLESELEETRKDTENAKKQLLERETELISANVRLEQLNELKSELKRSQEAERAAIAEAAELKGRLESKGSKK